MSKRKAWPKEVKFISCEGELIYNPDLAYSQADSDAGRAAHAESVDDWNEYNDAKHQTRGDKRMEIFNEELRSHNRNRLILDLAEGIEKNAERFDMRFSFNECGSPACIAGWTLYYCEGRGKSWRMAQRSYMDLRDEASEYLNLTPAQAIRLFTPIESKDYFDHRAKQGTPRHITPHHAAGTLRHLAETGKVDWQNGKTREMEAIR